MKVFDLHCDTLYKTVTMSHGFSCSDYEVQTDVDFEKYLQCFAVWIPDDLSIKQGRALFEKAKITLPKECKINNINLVDSFKEINNSTKNKLAMFTLENCKIIDNDISYIKYLADSNIKTATLTWNDTNCIGDGAMAEHPTGITEFGKKRYVNLKIKGLSLMYHTQAINFFMMCAKSQKNRL